jgi:NAD(P)-dependent dehydrogenase (short-subunit alcohol dehydrogenase family)
VGHEVSGAPRLADRLDGTRPSRDVTKAAAALFLASDEASFVTGAALGVGGGYLASGPMLASTRKVKP